MILDIINDISKWPWKGEVIGVVVGYLLSYFFYLKGKRDSASSAREASQSLDKANQKIGQLEDLIKKQRIEAEQTARIINSLKEGSDEHDVKTNHLSNKFSTLFDILNSTEESNDHSDNDIGGKFFHLLNSDQINDAEEFLEISRRKLKEPVLYFYFKGWLSIKREDYNGAIKILSTIQGDHFGVWKTRGELYLYDLGKIEEAIHCFSNAHRMNPEDPEVVYGLIQSFIHNDQADVARDKINEAILKFPNHARMNLIYGQVKVIFNEFDLGIEYMEKAISLGVNLEEASGFLGFGYLKRQEYEKALTYLHKVPHNHIDYISTACNIVACYCGMNRLLDAERAVRQFRARYPNENRIADYHILLYVRSEPQKAILVSQEYDLFSKPENNLMAINNLAVAHGAIGEYEKAIEFAELLLSYDPNHHEALGNLAAFLYNQDSSNLDQVQFYIERLFYELGHRTAETYASLGLIYSDRKDFEKALQILNDGLKQYPDHLGLREMRSSIVDEMHIEKSKIYKL